MSAALLFGLLVFAYLAPVLVGGSILSPAAALYQFPPWSVYQPTDAASYLNFILGDVPMSHYPLNVMAREFIHDGVFPAWSQHAYAGGPFFANPQTVLLSPFSLPMWILPLDYGIGVAGALKLWVAAFGMYLLVRELRLGFWPGILAGVSYALSAFAVLWLGHETLLSVAVMLPWMVWLAERTLVTGRPGVALALAPVTAIMLTGGHPGTMIHVAVAVGLFVVVRVVLLADVPWRARLRRTGLAFGAMALGALIVAVLLIPVVQAGDGTIGQQARIGENPTIPGAQLPFDTIRTALFPDWWGRPSALSLEGPANYNERTFFAGGVATIFAVLALFAPGAWPRKAPFALLAVIGLAVPLHAPVLYWLSKNLPLLGQVQHQRMMLLYVFGVAVLGAFGLQRLLDAPADRRRTWGVVVGAAVIGLVALVVGSPSVGDIGDGLAAIVRWRHPLGDLAGGPANEGVKIAASVTWWLLVVAVVALLVAALRRWPQRAAVVAAGIALLAAVDVLFFAHDYQPMAPRDKVHPPRTPAIEYLERNRDAGRVTGIDGALLNDWGSIYGLRDLRGTNPPQPSLRWHRLWQVVYPEQLGWAQSMMSLPRAPGLNVISTMGARFMVTGPDVDAQEWNPQLRRGYSGPDATVWVNPGAVPRVTVPRRVLVTGGEQETIATVADPAFVPRTQAVVEIAEPGATALGAQPPGRHGSAAVVGETNATVTLRATMRERGLVVLNDRYAPGWSVEVDGRPADAVLVNSVMRGVVVPAGDHEVVWRYAVPGLRTGAILSVLGLLGLAGASALLLVRRRRRPPPAAA